MVDPDTRADATICYGKQLHYKYTMVNYSIDDIDNLTFKNEMTSLLNKNTCNDAETVNLLKMGVEFHYIYFDKNGHQITTVIIHKGDCAQ